MLSSNFRPEAGPNRIEDSFLKETNLKETNDPISLSFLEGKQPSKEGSIEDAFLRDFDRIAPLETDTFPEAQIVLNKREGCRRENEAYELLSQEYKESDGNRILTERYLLDRDGRPVYDPFSETRRRLDFVVMDAEGKAIQAIEVTSPWAWKDDQLAKEERIRNAGGHFVRDDQTGRLVDLSLTPTEILRLA